MRRVSLSGLALAGVLVAAMPAAAQPIEQTGDRREVGPLVYDGIPAVPPSLRAQLQRYRNARSAGLGDWLADGSMLITTRFGETAQVHRVAMPGGARTQLTFFSEPVGGVRAVPGTSRFALSRDVGGAEYFQTWITDAAGREVQLTEPDTRNSLPIFSDDGRLAVWNQVRPGQPNYDILAADPAEPSGRRVIYRGQGLWSPVDVSPDRTRVLLSRTLSVQDSQLWLLHVGSGRTTRVRPSDKAVAYSGAEFTADGRAIVTASDEGSEVSRLVRIDLATNQLTPLTADAKWGVDGFELSPDGRILAYALNEDGISRLRLMELATGRALPTPDLPTGVLGGLNFSPDGRRLGVSMATSSTPGDVWSWDLSERRLTRWTSSEVGPVDASTFVTPELVRYRSFDGLDIPAFVYRPAGQAGRRPVIIDIHGGPEGQSRPGFIPTYQQWIADLGAAVIVPNVRGSTGYGKRWVSLDNGPLRQDSVRDIGALLDWIATQPDLDPTRVVVHGGSYGGFMVLASIAAYSDRLAGGVNIVGISSFVSFLENTEGYRRDLRRVEYGDERDPAMRAIFDQISPLNLTRQMKAPLLVIQGANDPRVPRSEAEQIVRAVRAEGQPVWYLLAMDEGHGFRKKSNADAQAEVTNLFLRQVFALPTP